jgi:mannose-1-phosphate guanylyltransferase
MRAILLVGGFGTRLRPLTVNRPKALIPILNRPFISFLLDLLKDAGVSEVVFAAGHLAAPLRSIFPAYQSKSFKLHLALEPRPLGTGGAIRFAYERFSNKKSDEPVLVLNGDVLMDFDARRFIAQHKKKGAAASVVLKRMPDPVAFGVVKITPSGRIRRFIEKPHSFRSAELINAGVYLFAPRLIRSIPLGRNVSVEREVFPRLLSSGESLQGFTMNGYWNDIGTHATYLAAHGDLLRTKNSWTEKYFLRKRAHLPAGQKNRLLDPTARVSPKAVLTGMVCCGRRVVVESSAEIENSVLLDGARVEEGARVSGAIIGSGSVVGKFSVVRPGTVLGDKTVLSPYTKV